MIFNDLLSVTSTEQHKTLVILWESDANPATSVSLMVHAHGAIGGSSNSNYGEFPEKAKISKAKTLLSQPENLRYLSMI